MNLGGEIYMYEEDGKLIASRASLLLCESSYSSHITFARTLHCLIPSFTIQEFLDP